MLKMQTFYKKLTRTLLLCIITSISCGKVSGQNTRLTISPSVVNENSSQTLTCLYSGSKTINSITWYANDIVEGTLKVNGVCSIFIWKNKNLHSYSCDVSSKTFNLTILNVRRSNVSDIWRCTISLVGVLERENSNNVTPSVKIFINSVNMTSPQDNTITIKEQSSQQFICVTSGGLPQPIVKWYNNSKTPGNTSDDREITSSITSTYSNSSDDLIITTSTLMFTATKYDNQINIYCSAYVSTDQTPRVSPQKPKLNVLYGPDGPPKIQGFSAGNTYRVIENRPAQLTCFIKGGNPSPTLAWTCFNTGISNNTDADTISKTASWTAARDLDRKCTCHSSHIMGNASVEIEVEILYPPTTPVFYIKSKEVSGTISVITKIEVSITCSSSGKPSNIEYSWKHGALTTPGNVLTTSNIKEGDEYTCQVKNSMNPSAGSNVPGKNSSSLSFEVLYPPLTPSFQYWNINGAAIPNNILYVIQNDTFKVACVSDSKPDPDSFKWDNNGNNQLLTVSTITADQLDHKYKCTVTNSMYETVPTTSNPTRGTSSSTLTVHVMYPPSKPTFKYRYGNGAEVTFTNTLSILEFNSFHVRCESNSEPKPTISWKNHSSVSSVLTFENITRSIANSYICTAENIMNRTFKNPEKNVPGRSFEEFQLHVLYPPMVEGLQNRSIPEGKSFSFDCPVKIGFPKETTFRWSKGGSIVSEEQRFTIQNVSRKDAVIYTCTVENSMQQTGEQKAVKGIDSKTMYLDVLYGAQVEKFYVVGFEGQSSVTINETATNVPFRCIVDSNPGSSMAIQSDTQQLKSGSETHTLDYHLQTASCLDAGLYTCLGNNTYNKQKSLKQLTLFVNCSPRNSPYFDLETNVTSQQNKSAVFTFTALAYPIPLHDDFQWFRQANHQWVRLTRDALFKIDTNNLTSSLTILAVNRTSFGTYKLNVKNNFGTFEQIFFLLPADKPEKPTNFIHRQELVTESSFTVEWTPGFDNGQEQMFILMYRKETQQKWTVESIPDSGEALMNYTVSALSSGTKYQVVLYASNKLGNSTETELLTISTKALKDEPDYGPLIGGVVGGSVSLAVFVVIGVIIMRRFNTNRGRGKSKTDKNDRKRVYEDDDNDYGMQDNPMYVSAGPRDQASGGSGTVYSGVDKNRLVPDSGNNSVYAEVNKAKKSKQSNDHTDVEYSLPVKSKGKKGKAGKDKKDKNAKKGTHGGDIYENAGVADTKTKQKSNDETIYENPEPSKPQKNVNKDGLIYADLAFNDQPKGQKKLVIHGLDSMTEYVQVDFTKKADPLPDSDDENVPQK